ncbi:MAG: dihydroorotate dehydrogenase [Planctomycetes bacterium]|nr:dihydroorotate dehydrogenase [Planctomycetota bacterium]
MPDLAGLNLRNPIVLSAGTCGYVDELSDVLDLSRIGAVITKSITRLPREGNRPPRVAGISVGMLNAVGLANMGLDQFLRDKVAACQASPCPVIGSIAGNSIDDYVAVAQAFDAVERIPAVELNVSCPNTADGLEFGSCPQALTGLLNSVRAVLGSTVMIVKLSPTAPDIVSMAEAAIGAGADGISLINTLPSLAFDVETRQPLISRGRAGMSGPAIHPLAVRMVYDVYHQVARSAGIPLIAYGGVMNWQDAAEFILAGATAVGMGTALFADPKSPLRVIDGLEKWKHRQGVHDLSDLIGAGQIGHPAD